MVVPDARPESGMCTSERLEIWTRSERMRVKEGGIKRTKRAGERESAMLNTTLTRLAAAFRTPRQFHSAHFSLNGMETSASSLPPSLLTPSTFLYQQGTGEETSCQTTNEGRHRRDDSEGPGGILVKIKQGRGAAEVERRTRTSSALPGWLTDANESDQHREELQSSTLPGSHLLRWTESSGESGKTPRLKS